MAKRKKVGRFIETVDVVVDTSLGTLVKCLPVWSVIEAARNSVELPSPPTYTITDVAGAKLDVEYDQAAIDHEDTPQEDKERWVQYQTALADAQRERNNKIFRVVATKGIKIIEGPTRGEFVEELNELDIKVPKKKRDYKTLYARMNVFGTTEDFNRVVAGIMISTGADEEKVQAIEATFRSQMGQSDGQDAESDPPDTEAGSGEET